MGSAYRSSNSTTYATRTNTSLTAPSGIQNGDILLIYFAVGAASPPTPTPPLGFNVLTGFPKTVTVSSFSVKSYIWYKVASGESGNYSVTHTSASSQGYIVAVSGGDTSVAPTATINSGVSSPSIATGLTTAVNSSYVGFFEHDWGDTANPLSPPTGTTPTFNERLDPGTTSGIMYAADGVLAVYGATGNESLTNNSNGAGGWAASLVYVPSLIPTYLQSKSVNDATTSNTTGLAYTTANLTARSLLIAVACWQSTTQTCTVSDSVNGSWTPISTPLTGTGGQAAWRIQVFYFPNTAGGSKPTVTMTTSGSNGGRLFAIHEYSGLATSSPIDQYLYENKNASGGVITMSSLPTTTNGDDLIFAAAVVDQSVSNSGAGFTLRENANFGSNGTEDKTVSSTGIYNATFPTNATNCQCFLAAFSNTVISSGTITIIGPFPTFIYP